MPPAQVKPEPDVEALLEMEGEEDNLLEKWYKDSFHMGLMQPTNLTEAHFCECFNCSQEGFMRQECPEPLSPALQERKKKQHRRVLNLHRGIRNKGGHAPHTQGGGSQPICTQGGWGKGPHLNHQP